MAGKKRNTPRRYKFKEEDYSKIEKMAGLGLPGDKIAAIFDMSKDTFDRHRKDNPQLDAAILKGRSVSELNVTRTAYEMAVSGKQPTMTIFWLKCRARWKDTMVIEHDTTGAQGVARPTLIIDLSGITIPGKVDDDVGEQGAGD